MYCFFNRVNSIRSGTRAFWQIIIGILVGAIATVVAYKQWYLAKRQLDFSIWLLKLDTIKFKIGGAKDDLSRILSQHDTVLSNKNIIEGSDIILQKIDAMIGITRKTIQESLDEYHIILGSNPMNFETKGIDTITSTEHTIEELREMGVKTPS